MSPVEIQRAAPQHASSIAEVHIRSFGSAYAHHPITRRSAETGLEGRIAVWDERLRRSDRATLVAIDDDRVVGFVHLGQSTDDDADATTGHIYSVHVDPDLTGMGIGGQLVAAATNALASDGFRAATLWVLADNERAQLFYQRLGWQGDGSVRTEALSVGAEEGDDVEVVRLRLDLEEVGE
jgi:ribosomal protein S18 acetylase RimI-like enzyme